MEKEELSHVYLGYFFSPIGPLEIGLTREKLCALNFVSEIKARPFPLDFPLYFEVQKQLDEYFSGQRKSFNLPLSLSGTVFQQAVWQRLLQIPYGTTASYKDIAVSLGREKAIRAVGAANRANPISIIVPCHRVIGADGSLVGYGGQLWRKKWLLEHERKYRAF